MSHAIRTHRLIVVQAPPGYGKTSSVALTVDSVGLPAVWYTAQPWHVGGFVDPLVSEVRTAREDFGRLTLALAAHGRPPSDDAHALGRWMMRIGASFAQELGNIPQRLVLVIEDCHVLEGDRALWDFVAGAMRQLPETVTLVLIGRAMPLLPLAEWTAAGRAAVFGAEDLKLTSAETELVARKHGVELDERHAAELCEQCEGWPAGIGLLLSTRTKPRAENELVNASHATRLIEQHVSALPEELREFLERISPLELLEASVLEQQGGIPAARHLLRDLERRGEMISVLQSGETYRLHPLMREAMLDRIREHEGDEGIGRRHEWAGSMLEAAGRLAPALFHLERARDEVRVVRFLNAHVDTLFADGHGEQVAGTVRALAKRGAEMPVLVGRVQGMLLRQRGLPGSRELFLAALQSAKQNGDEDSAFALRVQLLWGALDRLDPSVAAEIVDFAQEADTLGARQKANAMILEGWTMIIEADWAAALEKAAAAAELGAASVDLRYRAALLYAYAATCFGRFDRADAAMSELLRDLEGSEHVVLLCCTLFWYARLSLIWGDNNAAADYARQGMAFGRDLNLYAELASVDYVLAEIDAGAGKRDECRQATESLLEHAPAAWYAPDRIRAAAFAQQMLARCEFTAGSAARAYRIVTAALENTAPPPSQRAAMLADAATYATLQGDSEAAAELIKAIATVTSTRPFDAVDAASLASAAAMLGLVHAAAPESVAPEFADLIPAGPFQRFIESRKDLGELRQLAGPLQHLSTRAEGRSDNAATLLAASERLEHRGAKFEAAALSALMGLIGKHRPEVAATLRSTLAGAKEAGEPVAPVLRGGSLTKREAEVLALVALGLTNKEIAQRLDLSRRTVETHVERVLGKLNAASRTRAVAEAIRAGLLSADAWGGEKASTA
jgi:LuxR family maltose regulon positive regulatory protein